ncbi:PdaC/SigV domain-containing protein [Paenibacillus sp. FA6]|uniref:PdaC/SigV domain-containing protein n=1 Tax=Paenibacillus sp. FA6 TaxID=3413029 RepID=UPI003F65DE18
MNKAMRWGAAAIVAGVLFTSAGYTGQAKVFAAGNTKNTVEQPGVILEWKGTTLSQFGLISNGNTLIPVTVLRDQLGLSLHYNPGTRTYSIGSGYRQLNMDLTENGVNTNINNFYVNEYEVKNIGGKLYVPFRLISDYLGYQGMWNPSLKSLNITPRVENKLSITTKMLDTPTKDALFIVRYPTISGLADAKVEKSINTALDNLKNEFVEASKEQAAKRDSSVEQAYQFFQNYIVSYNENGVLSLVVDQYSYTGGAHGGTLRTGLTFSLENGKLLSLDDLLKEKSPDYKERLDKLVLKGLQNNGGYISEFKGLGADVNYYIKTEGIALFFQQYEYTAYAAGIPTFVIPYHKVLPEGTRMFK